MHKGKFENIEHDLVVLQILKLRNISAPKTNEMSKTAPKLLKLTLTDGQNTYSAIEMEPTALTLETRPGTKVIRRKKYYWKSFFLSAVMSLTLFLFPSFLTSSYFYCLVYQPTFFVPHLMLNTSEIFMNFHISLLDFSQNQAT